MELKEVINRLNDISKLHLLNHEIELEKLQKESELKMRNLKSQLKVILDKDKERKKLKERKEKEDIKLKKQKGKELKEKAKKEEVEKKNQEKKNEWLEAGAEEAARRQEREMIIGELENNFKKCPYHIFKRACEIDLVKKSINFFAKRYLYENKVITFEDDKTICKYSKIEGIYDSRGEITISEFSQEIFEEFATDYNVKEIINQIRRMTYVSRDILNNQPKNFQPVKNGLLNLDTGKIEKFDSKYIFFTKIDINFVKEAKCDKFIKFLNEIFEDSKSNIKLIQEWFGNLLLNDNRFQRALLLYGAKGENGKSVLLKVIGKFLGQKNCCSISLQFLEKNAFALARLHDKRANIFYDLPKSSLSQTSNFKMITSGDPVTAEFKGKDSFEYQPMTKLMFSCNEVPRTPDRTNAFFRRWIVLQFNQTFEEGNPRRIDNLDLILTEEKELEGILYFAFEGLKRLKENNKFTINMGPMEVREFWIKKSDSVASFAIDCLEEAGDGHYIEKRRIYGKYQNYCEEYGYEPITENVFFKGLKDFMNVEDYKPTITDDSGNSRRITALSRLKFKNEKKEEKTVKSFLINCSKNEEGSKTIGDIMLHYKTKNMIDIEKEINELLEEGSIFEPIEGKGYRWLG